MALESTVELVSSLGVAPVLSRVAVGVRGYHVQSLEFFEDQAVAGRIAVVTVL
jgi:hypothetical protein